MNNFLNNLASEVLALAPGGVSKVRFAKLIYFSYKWLILNCGLEYDQIKFIRMPLGPVPVGFRNLTTDTNITVVRHGGALLYDTEIYKLTNGTSGDFLGLDMAQNLKKIFQMIGSYPTSILVDQSHKDPSWINHKNGEEYFIQIEDLNIHFTKLSLTDIDPRMEDQKIQARLVEGMMEEIVEESTLLEYPEK